MVFTHDTEVALAAAAALVNTTEPAEQLGDIADLNAFARSQGWTGRECENRRELQDVRDLRPELREIWQAGEDDVVDIVNRLLLRFRALPQLVKHDQWDYHLHATPMDSPLAARMAVEAAMAIADVVRAGDTTITRLSRTVREDDTSVMTVHTVVADAGAIRHFTDVHRALLLDRDRYELAFRRAGLEVSYVPDVAGGRGLFVGSAPVGVGTSPVDRAAAAV